MKPTWYADKMTGFVVVHCRFDAADKAFRVDRAIFDEMLADNEYVSMIMHSVDGQRARMMSAEHSK